MRQILFVLAILGAMFSGWVPSIAAALDAGQSPGLHAMHHMAEDDAGGDRRPSKSAFHPLACSACFAIETGRIEPQKRRMAVSSRVSAATPRLAGVFLAPHDPPPRS